MNKGVSLQKNLTNCKTKVKAENTYIRACIYYNYGNYKKCLKELIVLYEKHNKIDHNLIIYSFCQMLFKFNKIEENLFCSICRIHSEIKDLYSQEQIETLNKAIFHYISSVSNPSICILIFLNDIIDRKVIQSLRKQYEHNNHIINDFISYQIDFENIKNKTVYNCYYNESSSGIGDFLRGCCYLFELLKNTETNYGISFTKHDISPYIKSSFRPKFKKTDIFDTEKVNKEFCIGSNYIKNIKNNIVNVLTNSQQDNIYLFTNYSDIIDKQKKIRRICITKECQEFMKKNIIFSKTIEDEYTKIISKISEDYIIMHFRLGDRKLINSNLLDDKNINTKEYNVSLQEMKKTILDKHKETGKEIIVMSDSNELKQYVQQTLDKNHLQKIHIIHDKSHHCSNNPGFISKMSINNVEKKNNMFYVALDMKLITKSSHIYSYSVYPWGSGFVFWLAKIFNIPIKSTMIGKQ